MLKEDIIKVLNKELDTKAKELKVDVVDAQKYDSKDDADIAKVVIISKKKKV